MTQRLRIHVGIIGLHRERAFLRTFRLYLSNSEGHRKFSCVIFIIINQRIVCEKSYEIGFHANESQRMRGYEKKNNRQSYSCNGRRKIRYQLQLLGANQFACFVST